MKACVTLIALLVSFGAAQSAVADDGQVSPAALRALGLGSMQVASDAQGMQVRGRSSGFVLVKGTSLIFGQLLTPDTKNFVVGSSVNEVDANGETTNTGTISATKDHQVVLFLNLAVTFPDGSTFTGNIGTFANPAFAAGSGTVSVTLP
jgi:hypothetical protein